MAKITIDDEVFEYDPTRMLNTEAIALQKATGMRIPEWTKALEETDAIALTALVWLLWRRNGKDVAFSDVEFDIGALELDLGDDEEEAEGPTPGEPGDVADPQI